GAPALVARHFELQLLSLMGYDFQVEVCASCSGPIAPEDALAAPAAGGLVCEPCRPLSGAGRLVSLRAMKVLRFSRSATMPQFAELKMDDALARELELVLGDAIRYVLEREPRTRRMLDDVAGLEQRTGRPPASVVD
ncbi:MAG: DNA repair protein RecO C-terminal domain-containing protein, partial [Dehalococcoidia bacterium]